MSSQTIQPKQIQLFLMPTPGAKPEFLATIEGIAGKPPPLDSSLPDKIVLENYTRDAWAWKPNPSVWQSFYVRSIDGRNKLPGFLKYLKDRQKSAFGRFADKESMWVISYIQKANTGADDPQQIVMECRLAWDIASIPGCPMKSPSASAAAQAPPKAAPAAAPVQARAQSAPAAAAPPKKKGGFGLLGKLVSSQQRTNAHMQTASNKPKQLQQKQSANVDSATGGGDGNATAATGINGDGTAAKKTAQQVMADFRAAMEEKMLDFDISPEPVLRVEVSLAEQQKDLATLEDKAKITMEILKYIVYEQAEEVNEEWIAHKEPSEFMDEVTIAVYKEGHAPPEVLEDLNKGELPDEVRGQQKAMQQEQQKHAEMKARSRELELQRKALQERAAEEEDQQVLNQNKRDRRTIEEIQREREQEAKKSRLS